MTLPHCPYYPPFGSSLPNRTWSDANRGYRFGFNNQEKDDEIDGNGNYFSFKFRIQDSRLGRFLSIDPLSFDFPSNSSYTFCENDLIRCIELEGLEKLALSGYVPDDQLYKKDPKTKKNMPGRTHYTKLHILLFKKQTLRLNKNNGYSTSQISSGKELLQAIETETTKHGPIKSIYFFGHAGESGKAGGLFMKNNAGFYTDNVDKTTRNEGFATISDLKTKMKEGKIKFADDAQIFLNACNTIDVNATNEVIASENSIAYNLYLETGVSIIGCSGSMAQKTPGTSDGKFVTEGSFYKLTRVEEEYEENSEKKKRYVVKSENLGKEITVDTYVKK